MKTKSRNFLITSLMIIAILFSEVPMAPFTAFAQGVITVPTIVSVGGIEVDQETTMGGRTVSVGWSALLCTSCGNGWRSYI